MYNEFFKYILDYGYGLIDPKDIPRGPYLLTQPENIIVSNVI